MRLRIELEKCSWECETTERVILNEEMREEGGWKIVSEPGSAEG